MTLRMARRIRLADIERLLGQPCADAGAKYFAENFPDGIDLATPAGLAAVQELYDRGAGVEVGLAVALDQDQAKRFIDWLIEERKQLLGVTTQEEIATAVLSEDETVRETAVSVMIDIGAEGRPQEVLRALRATEKAVGEVKALRDRAMTWFRREVADAVREGRIG